jgi:CubicO group peptidase (beta-lactamase class C family)
MSRDRMAQGYRQGRAVPDWHLGALAGAGALYSTAADLARFLQACLTAKYRPAGSLMTVTLSLLPGPQRVIEYHPRAPERAGERLTLPGCGAAAVVVPELHT